MAISEENSLNWREVQPGQFERGLDSTEMFFKTFCDPTEVFGRTNDALGTIVDYQTTEPNVVPLFKEAWLHMLLVRPHLAAEIQGLKTVCNTNNFADFADRHFNVIYDKPVDVVQREVGIMRGTYLYVFPNANKIMVFCSHQSADAQSQYCFFDQFFTAVVEIKEGRLHTPSVDQDMCSRLAPAFDALMPPHVPPQASSTAMETIGDMMQNHDGLPAHDLDSSSGNPSWENVAFSERETTAMLKAARARGTTLSPLLHAAVALASNKLAGNATRPYSGIIPVSYRRYAAKNATQPITVYLGSAIKTVKVGSFEETLKNMAAVYKHVLEDYDNGVMTSIARLFYEFASTATEPPPPMTVVHLSNPGRVDNFLKPCYGDFEIRRVAVQCREYSTTIFTVFSTFKGKGRATISYNDRYYSTEQMRDFARLWKSEILGNLGIEQEIDAQEVPL